MEFTHNEASLIINALSDFLDSTEEQYNQVIDSLEEGYLISPLALEGLREMHGRLYLCFDIQEKIFSAHPCPEARAMLFEELEGNREALVQAQKLLSCLILYQTPSAQEANKGDKDADTKSPEDSEVEKVEV